MHKEIKKLDQQRNKKGVEPSIETMKNIIYYYVEEQSLAKTDSKNFNEFCFVLKHILQSSNKENIKNFLGSIRKNLSIEENENEVYAKLSIFKITHLLPEIRQPESSEVEEQINVEKQSCIFATSRSKEEQKKVDFLRIHCR